MENIELKVSKEVKKEEVENLLEEKVTNEKIEESLNYDALSQEEKDAIEEFNKKINVEDATQILNYGVKAQTKISQFSDNVLEGVKTKSTGEVGDLLSDLVAQIKSFDSDVANDNKSLFGKLFSNAKKQVDKIIAKYNKIENNIDGIEKGLDKHKLQMLKRNMTTDMHDHLYLAHKYCFLK